MYPLSFFPGIGLPVGLPLGVMTLLSAVAEEVGCTLVLGRESSPASRAEGRVWNQSHRQAHWPQRSETAVVGCIRTPALVSRRSCHKLYRAKMTRQMKPPTIPVAARTFRIVVAIPSKLLPHSRPASWSTIRLTRTPWLVSNETKVATSAPTKNPHATPSQPSCTGFGAMS